MIDTIDIGSLTKKIRLSKKLSLKDVAGDYLSIKFRKFLRYLHPNFPIYKENEKVKSQTRHVQT